MESELLDVMCKVRTAMCMPEDIFTAEKCTHYLLVRTLLRGKHDLNFSPLDQPGCSTPPRLTDPAVR